MTSSFTLSEGIEKTLNVNVVSTFLLYLLLLPKMRSSSQETGNTCRYVIPNSALHYMAPVAELSPKDQSIMARLNDPKKADMAGRYPLSKLLVIYAMRELVQQSSPSTRGQCIINTPNPSFCKSKLARESQDSFGFRMAEKLLARSTEEGSRALINGLFAGPESNGQYITNCRVHA
jgi:NAD(P)-dependent dehydrogenase (short-subunit alcohol dehydrogenase family)